MGIHGSHDHVWMLHTVCAAAIASWLILFLVCNPGLKKINILMQLLGYPRQWMWKEGDENPCTLKVVQVWTFIRALSGLHGCYPFLICTSIDLLSLSPLNRIHLVPLWFQKCHGQRKSLFYHSPVIGIVHAVENDFYSRRKPLWFEPYPRPASTMILFTWPRHERGLVHSKWSCLFLAPTGHHKASLLSLVSSTKLKHEKVSHVIL